MKDKPVIHVVAAVIVSDGKLLVAQRGRDDSYPLKWELPGGKLEAGESLEQGLRRELEEELGVDGDAAELLCSSSQDFGSYILELHALRVMRIRGELRLRVHERIRWVRPEELPRIDFVEADLPLLEEVTRRWETLKRDGIHG